MKTQNLLRCLGANRPAARVVFCRYPAPASDTRLRTDAQEWLNFRAGSSTV